MQELPEDDEYISMIDFVVSNVIREIVCQVVSQESGIPYPDARQYLIDAIKEMNETPENIRCWFERNI